MKPIISSFHRLLNFITARHVHVCFVYEAPAVRFCLFLLGALASPPPSGGVCTVASGGNAPPQDSDGSTQNTPTNAIKRQMSIVSYLQSTTRAFSSSSLPPAVETHSSRTFRVRAFSSSSLTPAAAETHSSRTFSRAFSSSSKKLVQLPGVRLKPCTLDGSVHFHS